LAETSPTRHGADTTVLSGDVAAAIGELKAKPGGELQVHGSGARSRWLLGNDLVDEMNLLIVPVVVGQGTRLPRQRPGQRLTWSTCEPSQGAQRYEDGFEKSWTASPVRELGALAAMLEY
jgi:dihydrofolate reductase